MSSLCWFSYKFDRLQASVAFSMNANPYSVILFFQQARQYQNIVEYVTFVLSYFRLIMRAWKREKGQPTYKQEIVVLLKPAQALIWYILYYCNSRDFLCRVRVHLWHLPSFNTPILVIKTTHRTLFHTRTWPAFPPWENTRFYTWSS